MVLMMMTNALGCLYFTLGCWATRGSRGHAYVAGVEVSFLYEMLVMMMFMLPLMQNVIAVLVS